MIFAGRNLAQSERPLLVAELGINHNGDLGLAGEMIAAAAEAGADFVKLQSYDIDDFIASAAPDTAELRRIFESCRLSYEQHKKLQEIAEKNQVGFASTPLTSNWVQNLTLLKSDFLKIASGDLTNYELLTTAVQTKLPLVLSTGAADYEEIARTYHFLEFWQQKAYIFCHCVSLYPTPKEKAHLARLELLRKDMGLYAGFSDHTEGAQAALAAGSMGAIYLEKHFTLDPNLPGPDQASSATPEIFKEVRTKLDLGFDLRGSENFNCFEEEKQADYYGKRALFWNDERKTYIAKRPQHGKYPKAADYYKKIFSQD